MSVSGRGGLPHHQRSRRHDGRIGHPTLNLVSDKRLPVPAALRLLSPALAGHFATNRQDWPCLVMDLALVSRNYRAIAGMFPGVRMYYAVKANPAPAILAELAGQDAAFDCASRAEIELCLAQGVTPDRICYGSTVKKERDIAWAFARGVRLFAFDADAELTKLARAAPGARVYCRLMTDGAGADWPLSRKFGCSPEEALTLMPRARALGLAADGLSFHVGSQQTDPARWLPMIEMVERLIGQLDARGVPVRLVNLGGGLPARYQAPPPPLDRYGETIMGALRRRLGGRNIELMMEPGRAVVGEAGVIACEVVLVAAHGQGRDRRRWVYLDIGKFSGLAETMGEAIKYRLLTLRDEDPDGPVVLAGPSCDSADVLYESSEIRLPLSLRAGDRVWLLGAGAYTASYASVGFNGFPPLTTICV